MRRGGGYLSVYVVVLVVVSFYGVAFFQKVGALPVWGESAFADQPVAERILGEWVIAPYDGVLSGKIVFNENGKYRLEEKHNDGSSVGKEGQYKLDPSASPVQIDLCLGECGKPGSEWTTLFGILRFHSDDKLEIRTSPDSNYPKKFAKKKDDYTMVLTRGKY